jgi:hypothetical protein
LKRPEQEIQIAVMKHVRIRSMPGVFCFHVPNAGKRSMFVGSIMKQIGVVAGVPDLIFLYRGQSFGLELKASKQQKASDEQVAALNAMEVAGARTAIAHSLDEALITLECWGILRRNSSHRVPDLEGIAETA